MKTEIEVKKTVSFVDAKRNKFTIELGITHRNGYPEFTASGHYGGSSGQVLDHIKPANQAQTDLVTMWREWHLNGMKAGTPEQEQALESEDFTAFKQKVETILQQAKDIERIVNGPFVQYAEFIGIPASFSSARNDHAALQKVWRGEKVDLSKPPYITNDFKKLVDSIPPKMRPAFVWNSHVPPNKVKELFGDSYSVSCAFLESKCMLTVPHPETGEPYKYGSAWLRKPLPENFEDKISELVERIKEAEQDRAGENLSSMSDADLLALIEEKTTYEDRDAELFGAIVRHFNLTENDFDDVEINGTRVTVQGTDYTAGDDNEADEEAKKYILDSVWAFNASFLAAQTDIDISVFEALQGNGKCESNNKAILSMIDDEDAFCQAAITADGRGHFLNHYDGTEDKQAFNGTTYFFYQQ